MTGVSGSTLLYAKEDAGVIIAKTASPMAAFVTGEHNMTNSFRYYFVKCIFV